MHRSRILQKNRPCKYYLMLHTLEQGWRSKAPGGGGRSEATGGWGRSEARDHSCTYDPEGSRYVLWAISWEPHLGAIDADRSKNQLFFSIFQYDLQKLHGTFLHRSWILQKLANFCCRAFRKHLHCLATSRLFLPLLMSFSLGMSWNPMEPVKRCCGFAQFRKHVEILVILKLDNFWSLL